MVKHRKNNIVKQVNELIRERAVLQFTKGPEKRRLFWPRFQELTHPLHQQFKDELDV